MRLRVAGVVACLAVLVWLILLVVRAGLDHERTLPLVAGAWLVFAVAVWLVRGVPPGAAASLIVAGAIAVQVAALSAPPRDSSDLYRYIWDGRVQASGIDPYAYPPAAIQLRGLRNEFLWSGTGPGHYDNCVSDSATLAAGCTRINRSYGPTIYPPVAEAYFLGVQLLAPEDDAATPIQAAASLCALCTTLVLMYGLRRLGRNPRAAALWAWCPTVALEAGNNAHVDVLAVLLAALALLTLARPPTTSRAIRGGVLLGLAIATKMTPVLVVPAVIRRRRVLIVAAAAAIGVVYLPHVVAVGSRIAGFMPTYLKQEGYTTGTRFGIIDLVVGGRVATMAAVAILAVVALVVMRRSDPGTPWRGAVAVTAAALAVTTPAYQWYALLLVMLVALDGRPEWLALAAGGYLAAEPQIGRFTLPHPDAIGYGAGLAVALIVTVIRSRVARTPDPKPPVVRVTACT